MNDRPKLNARLMKIEAISGLIFSAITVNYFLFCLLRAGEWGWGYWTVPFSALLVLTLWPLFAKTSRHTFMWAVVFLYVFLFSKDE
jgi:hypothetical protein